MSRRGPVPTPEHLGRIVRVWDGHHIGVMVGHLGEPSVTLRTTDGRDVHWAASLCEVLSVEEERDYWRERARALDPTQAPTLAEGVRRAFALDDARAAQASPDESTLVDRLRGWRADVAPSTPHEALRADLQLAIDVLEDLAQGGSVAPLTRPHPQGNTQLEFVDGAGKMHVLARRPR